MSIRSRDSASNRNFGTDSLNHAFTSSRGRCARGIRRGGGAWVPACQRGVFGGNGWSNPLSMLIRNRTCVQLRIARVRSIVGHLEPCAADEEAVFAAASRQQCLTLQESTGSRTGDARYSYILLLLSCPIFCDTIAHSVIIEELFEDFPRAA